MLFVTPIDQLRTQLGMRSFSKWYYTRSEVIAMQGKVGWLWTCMQDEVHRRFRECYMSSKNCFLLRKNPVQPYFFLLYPDLISPTRHPQREMEREGVCQRSPGTDQQKHIHNINTICTVLTTAICITLNSSLISNIYLTKQVYNTLKITHLQSSHICRLNWARLSLFWETKRRPT